MAIEGKYGEITSSKKEFYEDEPLFLLRATDPFTVVALDAYMQECVFQGCNPEFLDEIQEYRDRIKKWQYDHPESVKVRPD